MPKRDRPLSLGEVARRMSCHVWQVRRLFERKFLPEPFRVGPYRVVMESDLPALERALRQAGYAN